MDENTFNYPKIKKQLYFIRFIYLDKIFTYLFNYLFYYSVEVVKAFYIISERDY